MSAFLLGIDVGTTGSKALLLSDDGTVKACVTTPHPTAILHPSWSEQNPEEWWNSTVSSIRRVLEESAINPTEIVAVGLTGQMHGLVVLNDEGSVLRPCILWNDQRSAEQCRSITDAVGGDRIIQLTGNPVLAGFTAPKILWIRDNEPHTYSAIRHVLLPKDYLRYRLTGSLSSDVSDASGTSLFDVGARCWSREMIEELKIPPEWLPDVTESIQPTARVTSPAAATTGLMEGTPVVAGAGDQAAQAVGMGAIHPGALSVTLGTSGVVFAATDRYVTEPDGRLHSYCHAVPGTWHLMGVMLAAGGSFRWYRDTLCNAEQKEAARLARDPYELLDKSAARAPAGCEGLIFLPYLCGERTPHPDPDARGAFVGLALHHEKHHLTRAVLEGVGFGLRDSLELMKELRLEWDQVRISGGGARSGLWLQILADIFNLAISTVNVTQGAAYGAAVLGGVGVGMFPNVPNACRRLVQVAGRIEPGPAAPAYDRWYRRYRTLYPALAPHFAAMAKLFNEPTSSVAEEPISSSQR